MPESADIIDEIFAAAEACYAARVELEALVRQARVDGVSWEEIGGVLGVTKQAAQQRFGTSRARRGRGSWHALQADALPFD